MNHTAYIYKPYCIYIYFVITWDGTVNYHNLSWVIPAVLHVLPSLPEYASCLCPSMLSLRQSTLGTVLCQWRVDLWHRGWEVMHVSTWATPCSQPHCIWYIYFTSYFSQIKSLSSLEHLFFRHGKLTPTTFCGLEWWTPPNYATVSYCLGCTCSGPFFFCPIFVLQ